MTSFVVPILLHYLITSITTAEIYTGSLIFLKRALSAGQVKHAWPYIVFRSEMAASHPTVSLRHSHSAGHIAKQIITITCQGYSLVTFSIGTSLQLLYLPPASGKWVK